MQRNILSKALVPILKGKSLDDIVRLFYNELDAIEDFEKLCNGVSVGKKISLLFNPHRLDTPTLISPTTVYQAFQDEHLIDGFSRMVCYDMSVGASEPFYHSCRRGFNGVQFPDEFPPYVAQSIYKNYSKKTQDKLYVLDPCCGWGGRMIGCASLPNTKYVGCEPSTRTYDGLMKLGKWLKQFRPNFEFEVYNIPYEDFNTDEKFDIALTSPPYYDTERYSDEATNSCNRYGTYSDWVDGFFTPLILTTVKRLNSCGVFILNVGDRKYQLSSSLTSICKDNNINISRIYDFLSGYGEGKEKFYSLSVGNNNVRHIKSLF